MGKKFEVSFDGKVAFITGAGKGMGRAIAKGLAEAGAMVVCTARTSSDVAEVVKEINDAGGKAIDIVCDVRNLDEVERACAVAEEKFGGIDYAIINAGVNNMRKNVGEDDPNTWRDVIDINLVGAYYCIRSVIPYMKKRGGGKIITLGSGRGKRGAATSSSYSCSKAGLWMLTRIVAEEVREFNIAVNEFVPGPVLTEMNKKFIGNNLDDIFTSGKEWVKEPEEIMPTIYYMLSLPDNGPTAQSYSLACREI